MVIHGLFSSGVDMKIPSQVGIYLHKRDYELDARSLIRKVFQQYFGSGGGRVGIEVSGCSRGWTRMEGQLEEMSVEWEFQDPKWVIIYIYIYILYIIKYLSI